MFASMSLLGKIVMLVYDIFLFVIWPGSALRNHVFSTKKRKLRRQTKHLAKMIAHRREWDRDILSEADEAALAKLQQQAETLIAMGDEGERPKAVDPVKKTRRKAKGAEANAEQAHGLTPMEQFAENAQGYVGERKSQQKALGYVREGLDLLVVVIGVVMGARALYLQPFKIPTGSMQPTLYGMHFVDHPPTDPQDPSMVTRIADYWNYARRYVHVETKYDDFASVRLKDVSKPFYPNTMAQFGTESIRLAGGPANVHRYLWEYREKYDESRSHNGKFTHANGHFDLGDHLFVERMSLNFSEPKRGDILVFDTTGMTMPDGTPLRGPFFIKRLVGLPGDTLRIEQDQVWVREQGQQEFRPLSGEDHPAFERIYSFQDGYDGHVPTRFHAQIPVEDWPVFMKPGEPVTLGPKEYFMLGDNTNNSQDSRYWGPIQRENIVGRAFFVYWPFGPRWGIVDQ